MGCDIKTETENKLNLRICQTDFSQTLFLGRVSTMYLYQAAAMNCPLLPLTHTTGLREQQTGIPRISVSECKRGRSMERTGTLHFRSAHPTSCRALLCRLRYKSFRSGCEFQARSSVIKRARESGVPVMQNGIRAKESGAILS